MATGLITRRLLVVRHAQARPTTGSDHSRALTAAGERAASSVGTWLGEQGLVPDYAMVSSAVRAVQTWSAMLSSLGPSGTSGATRSTSKTPQIHTEFSDDLYHAGPEDVIEALRWAPVAAHTIAYVGHNPTAGELPHLLDSGQGDRALLTEIATGYATAAISVLEVDCAWADLQPGATRLVGFFVGARS